MAQGKGRAFQGLVSLGGPRIITPLLIRRNKRINDGCRLPKNQRSGRESLRFVPLLLFRNSSSRWKKRRPLSNAIEQQIYERLFLWKTAKNSIGLGKSWTMSKEKSQKMELESGEILEDYDFDLIFVIWCVKASTKVDVMVTASTTFETNWIGSSLNNCRLIESTTMKIFNLLELANGIRVDGKTRQARGPLSLLPINRD